MAPYRLGQSRNSYEEGTVVTYAASEEHIAKLEGELRGAVDGEAETAQRLDSEHKRRAALDQQLYEAREEAARLMLEAASQTRTAVVAEAEELLEAARVEAEGEADQVIKHASDKADEMVALARREGMAIVDAGRKEVRALKDDAARQMADLATENRELTHRLGVMETMYDELVATLKLVAEISTEELVETQDSLEQLDLRETEQPPTEPNSEQITSGSAPQDELLESTRARADRPIQEAHEEADQSVHGAREPSEQHNQNGPERDSVHEADDGGGEELAVIIDDRDLAPRRSRYQRWLNLNRKNRDSKENRNRQDKAISERFNRILSSSNSVEDADPQEAEAPIRNLAQGTNRTSA